MAKTVDVFATDTLTETFIEKSVLNAGRKILQEKNIAKIEEFALKIAGAFGVNDSVSISEFADEKKLIASFNDNMTLLIQKTWVEKSDAELKEQVLYQLEQFCSLIDFDTWNKAYSPFLKIIYDAVYLMFGSQAKQEDFLEYAFRIDPGFGIFWWYIQLLPQETDWTSEKCRIIILLGMYFLANY
ncbi:hypothetical protein HRQ91_00830 [Treponema parvum]|uniref:Uncharacterized protein n=1 Tax=Treponema parvum TaxID=138851 RepID=A0A975IDI9_9SPIR|nr:hypothetical protein [Treponema parvum]QTQ13111.1 hypothetical protein HRQ91_00830 [Treponema parvum]